MPVITKETAHRIWTAHNQIETADRLLADIRETLQHGGDPTPAEQHHRHQRGYTLGVPHGSGERVLGVAPQLAAEVIEAHKDKQWEVLGAACALAQQELMFDTLPPPVRPPFPPDDEIAF